MSLLPPSLSTFGPDVDFLFWVILITTGIAFLLVQGALLYALIRFRQGAGERPAYIHGHHRLELVWTVIPFAILFWLALYQTSAWLNAKLRFPEESEAVVLEITARQFEWQARYPGPDGRLGTDDDILPPVNLINVPVDRKVLVYLEAEDVIHSLFLPFLRVKQDAVPGLRIQVWFQATETGRFELACAELCGLGHYRMRGFLTVQTPEEFARWLSELEAARARQLEPSPPEPAWGRES